MPFEDEQAFTPEEVRKYEERVAKRAVEQERREKLRGEAREAVSRASLPKKPKTRKPKSVERKPLPGRTPLPVDTKVSFVKALGERDGQKANRKLGQAAAAFEAGRFDDARKQLKPLADMAPDIPEVQELYGLSLYRLGRWQQAADRLEEFRALAGSPEQNPVLADCYRALGRWNDADFFWAELREYSPSSELITEGRIVAAGVLADQGKEADAIRLLEHKWTRPKRPKEHHLSRAYALADLYERVGDEPRARELFGWIDSHAPGFSDAGARSS